MARICFVVLVLAFVSADRSAGAAESQEAHLIEDSIAAVVATKEALDFEPLRVADSEAAEHVKRLPKRRRKEDGTAVDSGKPHRPGPSAADRLFKATSLSADDLENTRRTPVEGPALSSREERIVKSLRLNELP